LCLIGSDGGQYNTRSYIIHGRKPDKKSKMTVFEAKEKAIYYLFECLKKLYLERSDLIEGGASNRVKNLALES
jgi:hypothetical protein